MCVWVHRTRSVYRIGTPNSRIACEENPILRGTPPKNGSAKPFLAALPDRSAQRVVGAGLHFPDIRCQPAALYQRFPAGVREPNDFSFRKRLTQAGDGRKSLNDISKRTEADNQESRLRHAAPCEWIRAVRESSDPWDHPR